MSDSSNLLQTSIQRVIEELRDLPKVAIRILASKNRIRWMERHWYQWMNKVADLESGYGSVWTGIPLHEDPYFADQMFAIEYSNKSMEIWLENDKDPKGWNIIKIPPPPKVEFMSLPEEEQRDLWKYKWIWDHIRETSEL